MFIYMKMYMYIKKYVFIYLYNLNIYILTLSGAVHCQLKMIAEGSKIK